MKRIKQVSVLVGILCVIPSAATAQRQGVPASPHPVKVRQPDGTRLQLSVRGDEYYSWYEDADGYTVVETPRRYEYAIRDGEGKLIPTGLFVGRVQPLECGLKKRILPSTEFRKQMRARVEKEKERRRPRIPASPHPVSVLQPDGRRIKLFIRGDEYYSWYEDADGYSILEIPRRYEYAIRDGEGKLIPTGLLAGRVRPGDSGLKTRILPSREFLKRKRARE